MLVRGFPFMTLEKDWFQEPLLDAWYLSGPTASGKTQVALELAQRLDAEIVSLDSMAVYRGMDIGTAKPTREQTEIVRDDIGSRRGRSGSRYRGPIHRHPPSIGRRC